MSYSPNLLQAYRQVGIYTGQDSQRRQARRHASRAADKVRVRDQSQDRQGTRPDDSAGAPTAADEVIE